MIKVLCKGCWIVKLYFQVQKGHWRLLRCSSHLVSSGRCYCCCCYYFRCLSTLKSLKCLRCYYCCCCYYCWCCWWWCRCCWCSRLPRRQSCSWNRWWCLRARWGSQRTKTNLFRKVEAKMLNHNQGDQIGIFTEYFGKNFSYKSCPNIRLFWKMSLFK